MPFSHSSRVEWSSHPEPLHLGWAEWLFPGPVCSPGSSQAPSSPCSIPGPSPCSGLSQIKAQVPLESLKIPGSSQSSTLPSWEAEGEWRKGRGESTCRCCCYCPTRPASSPEAGAEEGSPGGISPSLKHIPSPSCPLRRAVRPEKSLPSPPAQLTQSYRTLGWIFVLVPCTTE